MKTTTVRIYPDDLQQLTELRRKLSILLKRDIRAAEAIQWLLRQNEAQRVLVDKE